MSAISVFFADWSKVSPGGKAAIGIRVDGVVVANCIGSAENFRDAKACAIRNVRTVLEELRRLQESNPA